MEQSIKKDHAAASVGIVASEVQEAKGKDDKILSVIQERKSTAKNESGKYPKNQQRDQKVHQGQQEVEKRRKIQ